MKKKGINLLNEELKQRFIAKKVKVKRYEQRISQFRQNQLFQVNQKQFYRELNEEKEGDRIISILKIVSNFALISGVQENNITNTLSG